MFTVLSIHVLPNHEHVGHIVNYCAHQNDIKKNTRRALTRVINVLSTLTGELFFSRSGQSAPSAAKLKDNLAPQVLEIT